MKKIIFYGILPLLMFSLAACNSVYPEGEYITEEREVDVYNSVSVEGGLRLILTDRADSKVTITTYENIQPYIETYVKGKQLTIRPRRNTMFSGNPRIRVYVSGTDLTSLDASGGSDIESTVALYPSSLSVSLSGGSSFNHEAGLNAGAVSYSVSGGGTVTGEVNTAQLTVSMSGGSMINLKGSTKYYDLKECSGGSDVAGFDMIAGTLSCSLSGGSKVKMTVVDKITVSASGGSQVRYKGLPDVISSDLSGGSSVMGE